MKKLGWILAKRQRRGSGSSFIPIISSKYKITHFPLGIKLYSSVVLAILINELQDGMDVNEAN